jgi:thioredoxin 1
MVAPIIDELASEYAGKVKVVKVEVDSNQSSAAKYGVRSIPSLAIFKGGQVVDMLVGARPKNEIAEKLDAALQS